MKFVSFTRLLVKNFQYQVYPFQFVKVYLKRYFYTIPQNKISSYQLKIWTQTFNSQTKENWCYCQFIYWIGYMLIREVLLQKVQFKLHIELYEECDLSIFALFRKILMYKTILFVYISVLFILWFLACFNYKLIELYILFCYWE